MTAPCLPQAVGRVVLAGLAASSASFVAAACDDAYVRDEPCTAIPDGGCPEALASACSDRSCWAVYRCERSTNTWSLVETCNANDREAGAVPQPFDGGGADDAKSNVACGALEVPDCPASASNACAPGCEDLFTCDDGGWVYVGSCGAALVGATRSSSGEQR